jgi:hypothetical protein
VLEATISPPELVALEATTDPCRLGLVEDVSVEAGALIAVVIGMLTLIPATSNGRTLRLAILFQTTTPTSLFCIFPYWLHIVAIIALLKPLSPCFKGEPCPVW